MKRAALALAVVCLATCLAAPAAYFRGSLGEPSMKAIFSFASAGWFVAAGVWSALSKRKGESGTR